MRKPLSNDEDVCRVSRNYEEWTKHKRIYVSKNVQKNLQLIHYIIIRSHCINEHLELKHTRTNTSIIHKMPKLHS